MRVIDRMALLDKIGRALQARMTFGDINAYFRALGMDTAGTVPSVNSKWIYAKEFLARASDEDLLRIAEELDIQHAFQRSDRPHLAESKFWKTGHFRLFVSHVSAVRDRATLLQKALLSYGISSFVAHEDIEPTKEWMQEIEAALFSMDALLAIVTPDFCQSKWTDQEVGVAIGRGKIVIPIRRGADPHGFIGKFQAIQASRRTVRTLANHVFRALGSHRLSATQLAKALADQVLVSTNVDDGLRFVSLLSQLASPIRPELERLRNRLEDNKVLRELAPFLLAFNKLLRVHDIEAFALAPKSPLSPTFDDIPF